MACLGWGRAFGGQVGRMMGSGAGGRFKPALCERRLSFHLRTIVIRIKTLKTRHLRREIPPGGAPHLGSHGSNLRALEFFTLNNTPDSNLSKLLSHSFIPFLLYPSSA
jgi:hypothetical protein